MIKHDPQNAIYNRDTDTNNAHTRAIVYRAGKVIQSAEMNELQSVVHRQRCRINNALFKSGDVVSGCQANLSASTGQLTLSAGEVYIDGDILSVAAAQLSIATQGIVIIGVWLSHRYVTETDDPSLRNPAVGARGQNEPGAWRLSYTATWGVADAQQTGDFYAVYEAKDGYLNSKAPPPHISGVQAAIARYDRDSTGSQYVVEGMQVHHVPAPAGKERYIIDAGKAQIGGYAHEYGVARPAVFPSQPDIGTVDSETSLAIGGSQRINVNRTPLSQVLGVRITKAKTVTITHANFANSQDVLPDASVIAVLSVSQGATTYVAGTDYQLLNGKIDWTLSGAEPAAGSTYSVTYHYIGMTAAQAIDEFGFTIADAVAGAPILTTYKHYIPRYDRLCLNATGEPVMLRGIASLTAPLPPPVPSNLLLLATIHQRWTATNGKVVDQDGVRVVSMHTLNQHAARLDFLTEQVAQNKLELSAGNQENGRKHGILADPLLTDNFRDAGRTQTAVVGNGLMTLPIAATAHFFDLGTAQTLDFNYQLTLSQSLASECMKINPYAAFDPIPGSVSLSPAVDRWTVDTSAIIGQTTVRDAASSRTSLQVASVTTRPATFCRPIVISAKLSGFGSGETIERVTFDGITVATTGDAAADADGNATLRFTIPDNVPAGQKAVVVAGRGGTTGSAVFTADGTLRNTNLRRVVHMRRRVDPLAQTFTLDKPMQLGAVDLKVCEKGSRPIRIQLRETEVGIPTQAVIAESTVAASAIHTDGRPTRFAFDLPVLLAADVEYALVVMSDEATPSVSIARLGGFDATEQRWITAQPYTIGAMLSSSNASTWTPHNDADLWFALQQCHYLATRKVVNVGTLSLTNATDLYVYISAQITSAQTTATIRATLPDGRELTFTDGQHHALSAPVTGDVTLTAVLAGNRNFSPVLGETVQVLVGQIGATGNYITRAIPAGLNSRVRVLVNAFLPQGSGITVRAAPANTQSWQTLTRQPNHVQLDDGFVELTFAMGTNISAPNIQVEIELSGGAGARPRLANPRILIIKN